MRKTWPGILAAVAISTAACGGSSATSPAHASPNRIQVQQGSMTVDGLVRSYTLVSPLIRHPGQLIPLVVAIHGYTVDSTWMEKTTQFDELAKSARFIVVYPQGLNNSWNAGSCCGDSTNAMFAFIAELRDQQWAEAQVNRVRR